jgi:enoyl-[acyl-carrier-protein] reductase (NADH)
MLSARAQLQHDGIQGAKLASVRYMAESFTPVKKTKDGRATCVNGISAGPIKTLAASGISTAF